MIRRLPLALWWWIRATNRRLLRALWTWQRRRRGLCVHRAMWRTEDGHWRCDLCKYRVGWGHP